MQSKNVEIGKSYEIEVDGLEHHRISQSGGREFTPAHPWTNRGVREKYGTKVLGKVVAIADLVKSSGTYSRYYTTVPNGGFLVEFEEPVKDRAFSSKRTYKTAVVDARHIIRSKDEVLEQKRQREEWAVKHDAEVLTAAEAFEPEIEKATALLKTAGLNPRETESAIEFDGGRLAFKTDRFSGDNGLKVITGWSWKKVEIERDLLFKLLT